MPQAQVKGASHRAAGRITTVRLDPEAEQALQAIMHRDRVTKSEAIRIAIMAAVSGTVDRAPIMAALARIEARLAAGGCPVPVGAVPEPPQVGAEQALGIQAGDTAWLPDDER